MLGQPKGCATSLLPPFNWSGLPLHRCTYETCLAVVRRSRQALSDKCIGIESKGMQLLKQLTCMSGACWKEVGHFALALDMFASLPTHAYLLMYREVSVAGKVQTIGGRLSLIFL